MNFPISRMLTRHKEKTMEFHTFYDFFLYT